MSLISSDLSQHGKALIVSFALLFQFLNVGTAAQADKVVTGVVSSVLGVPADMLRKESLRVDFRPITLNKSRSTSDQRTIELELKIELENAQDTRPLALQLLKSTSAKLTRLQLDSKSIAFESSAAMPSEVEARFGILWDSTTDVELCSFDTSITSGKHRLEITVRVPPSSAVGQHIRYMRPATANKGSLDRVNLLLHSPDHWLMRIDNETLIVENKFEQEYIPSASSGFIDIEAIKRHQWELLSNLDESSAVYEFDRRFSISGWLFHVAVIAMSTLAAIVIWLQGAKPIAYLSLLSCGLLSVLGLTAGFALPAGSNQMRVIRQQDHDQLMMLANRLFQKQWLKDEPDLAPYLLTLMREGRLHGMATCFQLPASERRLESGLSAVEKQSTTTNSQGFQPRAVSIEDAAGAGPDDANHATAKGDAYFIVLRDGPESLSMYQLQNDHEGRWETRLVATSPIKTNVVAKKHIEAREISTPDPHLLEKLLD